MLKYFSFILLLQNSVSWAFNCAPNEIKKSQEKIKFSKRLENIESYENLCNCNMADSCYEGGMLLSISGLTNEAKNLYNKGCKLKSAPSCQILSITTTPANTPNLLPECQKGNPKPCFNLALSELAKGKLLEARTHFGQACQKKDNESCHFAVLISSQLASKSGNSSQSNSSLSKTAKNPKTPGNLPNGKFPNKQFPVPQQHTMAPKGQALATQPPKFNPPPKANNNFAQTPNSSKITPLSKSSSSTSSLSAAELKVLALFKKNNADCDKKNSTACVMAGNYLVYTHQIPLARVLYFKACNLKNEDGCKKLNALPVQTKAPPTLKTK